MASETFDVIVIGAGPAGENVADYATQRGLSVAVVERELVGGECHFWGCIPSKALLRPTQVLEDAERIPAAARAITGDVDVEGVLRSRDAFVDEWDDADQVEWLRSTGATLVRGHGRISGERQVEVTASDGEVHHLAAEQGVVIAIGSRAAFPPIEGLSEIGAWDNRHVTEITQIPRRLIVLGGGPVGVEMAQAISRLGGEQVTIVEAQDRLVNNEEPFVSDELVAAFREEGISVVLGAEATQVSRDEAATVHLELDDGRILQAEELLVAVGRHVASDDLGLESIGVEPGPRGFIEVDGQLRVADHPWLRVVGDANGRNLLTHQGKYQARFVGDSLAGIEVAAAWADELATPRIVFTDPQIAAVGLTEEQAQERFPHVRTVTYDIGDTAGGSLQGVGFGGTAQLVVDDDQAVIVGATLVGPGVSELLHAATIAIVGEVPIERLWHAVPSFPTVSEVWLRLLEELRREDLARDGGGAEPDE